MITLLFLHNAWQVPKWGQSEDNNQNFWKFLSEKRTLQLYATSSEMESTHVALCQRITLAG